MKKTEKIELRVDHTEKDRLSAIAERRGLTVSDVVREALSSELGVAQPTYPKWPGILAIVAFLVGLAALLLATAFNQNVADNPADELIYPETVNVSVQLRAGSMSDGTFERKEARLQMILGQADTQLLDFQVGNENTFRVKIDTSPDESGPLLHIEASACRIENGACDLQPMPKIAIETEPKLTAFAETGMSWAEDAALEIMFQTQTLNLATQPTDKT
ncbi:MAG: hypothetical protein AAFP97_10715 [Pseudomonadota bacterium]